MEGLQTTNSWYAQVTNSRVQWVTRHGKQDSRSRCEGAGEVPWAMNELQGPVTGRCSGAIDGYEATGTTPCRQPSTPTDSFSSSICHDGRKMK